MTKYRVYVDGTVVHEDDFHMYDEGGELAQQSHGDYSLHTVPDGDEDAEYWDIPKVLLDYITKHRYLPA